jgi:4-hydroxy-4-methyl-2-oxoglutarate aldolase
MEVSSTDHELSHRLEKCYSGALYDVLRAMGYPNQVLPSEINPLSPDWAIAGKVFTVSGHSKPNLDAHETLLSWTGMLSAAPSGAVVMCQPNDDTVAHMGELSAETFHLKKIRGYIADGGSRDTRFIKKINFPVFCKYTTPRDVVSRWEVEELGGMITIGGVNIHAGDFVLADFDGVVIAPQAVVREAIEKTEQVMTTENKVRTAIMAGADPQKAYLKYGKF